MKVIILLLLVLFHISCKSFEKNYTDTLRVEKEIILDSSFSYSTPNKLFGIHFVNYNGLQYVAFLDHDSFIKFLPLDKEVNERKLDFEPVLVKTSNYFSIRFYDSKLFLLDISKTLLQVFNYESDTLFEAKRYDFSQLLDWRKYYIKHQFNNSFEIFDSLIFLSYGIHNSKSNYLDDRSYLITKLDSGLKYHLDRELNYPKQFRKGRQYSTDTYLRMINDSCLLYTFKSMDSIYIYNFKSGKIIFSSEFNKFSQYRQFEKKKAMDLGYVRWYEFTNEMNVNVVVSDGKIIILKRLKKENINDKSNYEYYVLDASLGLIYNNKFEVDVNPNYCFPSSNGFIIFDKSMLKAYQYAM